MKCRWPAAALLWLVAALAVAQPMPEGVPQPGKPLHDRDFGVSTRQFGLEREVEMYQWRAVDDGYQAVWNSARIDSSPFAPGHENPAAPPLESRRWWAEGVTLDGHPLDPQVLRSLGSWQPLRPNFSRLPANLAASFQPEGDGLGSSENPLAPQVGDLRVRWRELMLPALAGKLELRGGVWQATAATAAAAVVRPGPEPVIEIADVVEIRARGWWPWLAAAVAVLAGLLLLLIRYRRRRRNVRLRVA